MYFRMIVALLIPAPQDLCSCFITFQLTGLRLLTPFSNLLSQKLQQMRYHWIGNFMPFQKRGIALIIKGLGVELGC